MISNTDLTVWSCSVPRNGGLWGRGGQDQFFFITRRVEARNGPRNGKRGESRREMDREMGYETEFETRNGREMGNKMEFETRNGRKWETRQDKIHY